MNFIGCVRLCNRRVVREVRASATAGAVRTHACPAADVPRIIMVIALLEVNRLVIHFYFLTLIDLWSMTRTLTRYCAPHTFNTKKINRTQHFIFNHLRRFQFLLIYSSE